MERKRRHFHPGFISIAIWLLTLAVIVILATGDARAGTGSLPATQPAEVPASSGIIAYVGNPTCPCRDNPDGASAIYSMNANGGNVQQLTTELGGWGPDIKPGGTEIAFAGVSQGFGGIFLMNIDGSNQRPITQTSATMDDPAWSPDGSRIAYATYVLSGTQWIRGIWVMSADGTNAHPVTILPDGNIRDSQPSWSVTNKIAFVRTDTDTYASDIYVVNLDGSGLLNISNTPSFYEADPTWSPDGSTIAYTRYTDSDSKIAMMNADGTSQVALTEGPDDRWPDWSPDGTEIIFARYLIEGKEDGLDLFIMDYFGNNERRITYSLDMPESAPSWAPAIVIPKVLVQDQNGLPVQGANVYRECALIGTTNVSGTVTLTSTLALSDTLMARTLVYTGTTNKGSHDNWAYHVWLTNITQDPGGFEAAYTVTDTGQLTHTLVVSPTQAQIGFNIVASVEYNATDNELATIAAGLGGVRNSDGGYNLGATDYLMDVTDGQMYFEKITIYEDKQNWDDADYQFFAHYPRADANARIDGRSALTGTCCHIHVQGSGDFGVQWNQVNAFSTLIHEFAHYAMGVYDEYYYQTDGDGAACNIIPHPSYDRRSSIMWNQRNSSEFCTAANHNVLTRHEVVQGTDVWQTIEGNWADSPQLRWMIQTPTDRGISVMRGPYIPLCTDVEGAIPQIVTVADPACASILVTVTEDAVAAIGVPVNLQHNGYSIYQGTTDINGQVRVFGGEVGDRITARLSQGFPGFLYTGDANVTSCGPLTIPLSIFRASEQADQPLGQWPTYWLTGTMDYSTNQVHATLHFGSDPPEPPALYASQGGTNRQTIALTYDPVLRNYTGIYPFDPDRSLDFQFEVGLTGDDGELLFPYRFEGAQFHTAGPQGASFAPESWDLFSPEAKTNLSVNSSSLPDGTGVMGGHVDLLEAAPNNLIAVGGPFGVQGDNAITGEVHLSLEFQSEYFCGLIPGTTAIYRYNGSVWDALPTELNEEWHVASAQITEWGIYAVFAQPNPQTAFSDVPPGSTFHEYISWMTCHAVATGYSDNTFRPNNNATRGQISKMIALAYQWYLEPPSNGYTFADVLPGSTFHLYVEAAYREGVVSGYPCGGAGEPCDPQNRPYFRPSNNVTRGQIAKIIANGSKFTDPVLGQTFEDVAPGTTFYEFVGRMASRSIINGYACGGPGEPCGPGNRPYFRPGANATRGQLSKMIYLAAQPR